MRIPNTSNPEIDYEDYYNDTAISPMNPDLYEGLLLNTGFQPEANRKELNVALFGYHPYNETPDNFVEFCKWAACQYRRDVNALFVDTNPLADEGLKNRGKYGNGIFYHTSVGKNDFTVVTDSLLYEPRVGLLETNGGPMPIDIAIGDGLVHFTGYKTLIRTLRAISASILPTDGALLLSKADLQKSSLSRRVAEGTSLLASFLLRHYTANLRFYTQKDFERILEMCDLSAEYVQVNGNSTISIRRRDSKREFPARSTNLLGYPSQIAVMTQPWITD